MIETITATEAALRLLARDEYRLAAVDDLTMPRPRPGFLPMYFGLGVEQDGRPWNIIVEIPLDEFPDVGASHASARDGEWIEIQERVRRFNEMSRQARMAAVVAARNARQTLRATRRDAARESVAEFSARMRALNSALLPAGTVVDPETFLMRVDQRMRTR